MLWIKRNLFFFLGSAVAVILLGVAVFNLLDKLSQDKKIKEELDTQWSVFEGFYQMPVTPTDENVRALLADVQKLAHFSQVSRTNFTSIAPFKAGSSQEFKTALDRFFSQLNAGAKKSGVKVPTNYYYSFQGQASRLSFPGPSIRTMTYQMAEIQKFCEILFDAKVNRIESIQRAQAGDDETSATSIVMADYVPNTIREIPGLGWVYPYRVTFRCFSSELADVLEGFVKTPYGFVIRTMEIEDVPLEAEPIDPGPAIDNPLMPPIRGPFPGRRPFTPRTRGGAAAAPATPAPYTYPYPYNPQLLAAAAKTNKGGLEIILNEKPFRVTMFIETIKLNERR